MTNLIYISEKFRNTKLSDYAILSDRNVKWWSVTSTIPLFSASSYQCQTQINAMIDINVVSPWFDLAGNRILNPHSFGQPLREPCFLDHDNLICKCLNLFLLSVWSSSIQINCSQDVVGVHPELCYHNKIPFLFRNREWHEIKFAMLCAYIC